jgi:hypothetical protein
MEVGRRVPSSLNKSFTHPSQGFRYRPCDHNIDRIASRGQTRSVTRFLIALFPSRVFGHATLAAPLERWVYAQVNLRVPEETQRLETLMRRACFVSGLPAR